MAWHEWYPPRSPLPKPVMGKERKKFGTTWWGIKWIEIVEREGDPNRMSRGRAYARAESVYNIKLTQGAITAKVKGNYGTYKVSIKTHQIPSEKWRNVIARIKDSPAVGMLLNNELPQDMDKVMGIELIDQEPDAKCSCPDYEVPCKHIAALYYLLADEIDKAPQILFALRGIEKKQLFDLLVMETPVTSRSKKNTAAKTPNPNIPLNRKKRAKPKKSVKKIKNLR